MVLTKPELIGSLKHEVNILVHLAGKVDRTSVDYRPTAKQRSSLELLQYLTFMGPVLVPAIKAGAFDPAAFTAAETAAKARNFEQTVAALERMGDDYATQIGEMSDADLRGEIEMFGRRASRGAMLVSIVLSGHAAYRTQLFCYLKSCGREELSTMNLWAGADAPATV